MPFNSNIAVPVALGLSLVSVTAFVIYYILKDEVNDKKETKVKTTPVNVIEVTVPKSIVPALIGRSGSNIKEIERKSGALIHFKKFSDKEYDVCILRGRSEATQIAETLIHEFIKQQPNVVEDTMDVPNWSCGRIIGTGGENIKDISHRSGARVKVEGLPSNDNTLLRVINLKGTTEQILQAKELINKCVAQENCRREILSSKRSPRHATPSSPPRQDESPADPAAGEHKLAKYTRTETSGASIEVYVSAVSSPSRFWVQLAGPQVAQLDQLVDDMSEYYGDKDNREAHLLKHVSVGQVVAAVFRHDGRWYRARVVDIRPNEFDATKQVADVFFLDYGDSEYVGTHELCELRADLLRLRFQAMECFLAGVRPGGADAVGVTAGGQRWDKWTHQAIERFEQLTQVARWKSLVSRTCTYKKAGAGDGEKDKEIPGIKLFDVTEEGELDIGNVLICEGLGVAAPASPRASPPRPQPTPFGDLGNSMVLGMLNDAPMGPRCSSLPKEIKDEGDTTVQAASKDDRMTSSKSVASGLGLSDNPKSIPNSEPTHVDLKPHLNGSQEQFLDAERDQQAGANGPVHHISQTDMLKANMNRIDSHHGSLDSLARQHELHK